MRAEALHANLGDDPPRWRVQTTVFAPTLPDGFDVSRLDGMLVGVQDERGRCLGLGVLEHVDDTVKVATPVWRRNAGPPTRVDQSRSGDIHDKQGALTGIDLRRVILRPLGSLSRSESRNKSQEPRRGVLDYWLSDLGSVGCHYGEASIEIPDCHDSPFWLDGILDIADRKPARLPIECK